MTQCFKPTDANCAFRSNRLIHVTKDIDYLMGVGLYMYFCFLSQEVVSLCDISEAYFTSPTSCPTGIFKLCDAAKTATYFAYTAIHHQLRFTSACVLNVWGERWIQTRSDNFYNFFSAQFSQIWYLSIQIFFNLSNTEKVSWKMHCWMQ